MKYQQTLLTSILSLSAIAFSLPGQAQSSKLPAIAKVTQLTNGDLACYVDLVDEKGKKYPGVFAHFEICEQISLLNKKVKLTYQKEKFNDCQSAEPCGKTQTQKAIIKMQLVR